LRVREYLVGLGELLETLFCLRVAGISVRVVLPRQPSVSSSYLVCGRVPGYSENLVWILPPHPLTLLLRRWFLAPSMYPGQQSSKRICLSSTLQHTPYRPGSSENFLGRPGLYLYISFKVLTP